MDTYEADLSAKVSITAFTPEDAKEALEEIIQGINSLGGKVEACDIVVRKVT